MQKIKEVIVMPWEGTDPIKWASKVKDAPREAINAFAFKVFEGVVDKTPVDTGACRQNWLVSVNSETDDFDPSKEKSGYVMANGGKVIETATGDDKIFIQNNAPYVRTLEYGGYPNPPKKGGKTSTGLSKTVNGYSRQAPNGMVGLTLAKANQIFEAALEAIKGKL
jgi:hypothetical protein